MAIIGLAVGAAVGAALAVARVLLPDLPLWIPIAAVVVGGLIGGVAGDCHPPRWSAAAHVIDNYYGLKDRALTALQFEQAPDEDPLRQLQLQDAERHLAQVRPGECAPVAAPRRATQAAAALVGLTLGLLWYSEFERAARKAGRVEAERQRTTAEAVLDHEPLPLGHRQTVRQYFENIRPNRDTEALP